MENYIMTDTKWSQFPNGGPIVDTDKLVGLRAGVNIQYSPTEVLLSAKNLSDVTSTDTSRTNLSVPKISSGTGSPQGVVAGVLGDLYIDTIASTDKFYVCIVAGTAITATWQVQTNLSGALLVANNLADVANPVTSLANIGGQQQTIVGTGDPNGFQAGTAGTNFYFDTVAIQLWICTQTGTSSTAVWAIQNQQGGGIDTVNLISSIPVQMLSNKMYIGLIASPSPAAGIMPIAPTPGDMMIIYAAATAGVTIQKGTAGIINVTNNLVTTSLFIPFRNTLVLRCSNSAAGGQWFSESIDDTVVIDGTTTVGYQPLNIIGVGDPNGNQAGILGVNFYFETVASQLWMCTQTGSTSTAVWQIQNEQTIETVDLTLTTPVQMEKNKFYVGVVASPSPAIGIMPIAPKAGDLLVIYAPAAAGVMVQKGTAALIEITGNLVTSFFFIPQRSNAVFRCFSAASGGQWFLESSDGPIVVDGTIRVGYVTRSDALIPRQFYFSGSKGSDTIGNGSPAYPYATYSKATTEALPTASASNPAVVFAMGAESITGGMIIHPFVNISGYGSTISSITCSGVLSLDPSFDSLSNASCIIKNIDISAVGGVNFIFSTSQQQQIIFSNATIIDTPTVNIEGSGGVVNEMVLFYSGIAIAPHTAATYTLKNLTAAFDNFSANGIVMDNQFATNQSILEVINNATPGALGTITIKGVTPYPGSVLYAQNSYISGLTVDGDVNLVLTDATSYTSFLTLTGGAVIDNLLNLTISDGITANNNFTPLNYTLPIATLYPQLSVTNNFAGIDNELGVIKSPPLLYASNATLPDITLVPGGTSTTFLAFKTTQTDTTVSYNNTTCEYNIPKTGWYEIYYHVRTTATGVLLQANFYFDTAIFIDGSLNTLDEYCSKRRTDLGVGIIHNELNTGKIKVHLNQNQKIKVNSVNNGNMNVVIQGAALSIEYLRS
jgi:hypothetical protein